MDNDKERTSLQEYLLLSQKRMELPEQSQAIHIVTGNEACDLDSAVSALVYAFHLWKTDSANNDAVLPLLNVPRKDYVLKTEVAYALTKQGIEQSNLIFADDLDPVRLHQERRLQVTLVDHHLPVGKFSGLTDAVKEVIDHRPVEQGDKTAYLKDISSTTETVGSCCTLIAEKILAASDAKSLTPVTAYLLYETIILDTVNFSKDAQKATQKDEHIADELQKRLPTAAVRDQIFSELVDAKSDISCLNTEQLLRKDLKVLDIQEIKIAVSSIPKLVRHCLKADDAQAEIETFCRKYDYTGLIVLGVSIKDTSVQRDMLCFAPDMSYVDLYVGLQLLDDLNNAEVKLGLERDPTFGIPDGRYQYFKQGNVKASRKQILPVVKQIIEQRLADMHTTGLMESPPRPPSRCGVMENTDDFGDQNGTASTFFATEPISPHGIPPKAAKRLGEMLTPTSTPNTNVTDNADGCYESLYGQIDSDSSIDTENTENSENDMLSLEEALALNKDSIEVRNTVAPSSFLRPLNNLTPNGPVSHSPFPGSDTSGSLDTHCLPTPRQTRTRPHMHLERGDVLDGGSGAGTPVTPGTGTEPVNAGERTGWSSASSLSPATPMAQWSQPPLARPNVSAPEMTGEFLHHDTPKDSEKVTDDHPTENEADTDKENSGDVTVLMDASFSADDSSGAPKSAVGTFHVVTSVVRLQNSNRPRISEVMDVETFPPSIPGLVNEKTNDKSECTSPSEKSGVVGEDADINSLRLTNEEEQSPPVKKRFLDEVDGEPAKKFAPQERSYTPIGHENAEPYERPGTPTPLDNLTRGELGSRLGYNEISEIGNGSAGAHPADKPTENVNADATGAIASPNPADAPAYPWSPRQFMGQAATDSGAGVVNADKGQENVKSPLGEVTLPEKPRYTISETVSVCSSETPGKLSLTISTTGAQSIPPETGFEIYAGLSPSNTTKTFFGDQTTGGGNTTSAAFSLDPWLEKSDKGTTNKAGSSDILNKDSAAVEAKKFETACPTRLGRFVESGNASEPQTDGLHKNALDKTSSDPFATKTAEHKIGDQVDGWSDQERPSSRQCYAAIDERWYGSSFEPQQQTLRYLPLPWHCVQHGGDQLDGFEPNQTAEIQQKEQKTIDTESMDSVATSDDPAAKFSASSDANAQEALEHTVEMDVDKILSGDDFDIKEESSTKKTIDSPFEEKVVTGSEENIEPAILSSNTDMNNDYENVQREKFSISSAANIHIPKKPVRQMSPEEQRFELLGYDRSMSGLNDANRPKGHDVVDSAVQVTADIHAETSEPREKKFKSDDKSGLSRFADSVLLKKTGLSFEYPAALSRLLSENDRNVPGDGNVNQALETESKTSSSSGSDTASDSPIIKQTSATQMEQDQENVDPGLNATNNDSNTVVARRVSGERDEIWAVDMNVLEPYKKVLHISTMGAGKAAIDIVCFFACYLPPRTTEGYENIMQNIFRYFVSSLDVIVDKQCKVVFFNGAIPKNCYPRASWLQQCCRVIDRRMEKTIQELIIVHPNFWFKTQLQTLGRATLSTMFHRKIRYVEMLDELLPIFYGATGGNLNRLRIPEVIAEYDLMLKAKKPGRRLSWELFAKSSCTEEAK